MWEIFLTLVTETSCELSMYAFKTLWRNTVLVIDRQND